MDMGCLILLLDFSGCILCCLIYTKNPPTEQLQHKKKRANSYKELAPITQIIRVNSILKNQDFPETSMQLVGRRDFFKNPEDTS